MLSQVLQNFMVVYYTLGELVLRLNPYQTDSILTVVDSVTGTTVSTRVLSEQADVVGTVSTASFTMLNWVTSLQ